jgi:uncharacterized protein (DUF924 family)
MKNYEQILSFWFGNGTTNLEVITEKSSLWWKKSPALDAEIKQRFEPLLTAMKNDGLVEWKNTAGCLLAMIILADQFSRNIYRETPAAFENDHLAISLSLEGIKNGKDQELKLVERIFFYMPLMHSESRELQDRSAALFGDLVDLSDPDEKKYFQGNLNYAIQHRDIVVRFGRFPHRNRILGRQSTAEEQEFLKTPGSSF